MEALHRSQLTQMEEESEFSGHGPECQEGGQDLGEEEEEVQEVDSPFQRQDNNSFISREEKQHRQLEDERQEPEGCQLWHLMTGREVHEEFGRRARKQGTHKRLKSEDTGKALLCFQSGKTHLFI